MRETGVPMLPTNEVAALAEADPDGWGPFAKASRQKQRRLRDQAQMSVRAMDGWQLFSQPEDNADPDAAWSRLCVEAGEQYQAGRFLIEQLGAERYMDPKLMATIWRLRQQTIDELGLTTTPELMLLDLAVIAYYNVLRIQR